MILIQAVRTMKRVGFCAVAVLVGLMPCGAEEKPPASRLLTAEQTEFFEKKIRPVLVKHCYQCHSQE